MVSKIFTYAFQGDPCLLVRLIRPLQRVTLLLDGFLRFGGSCISILLYWYALTLDWSIVCPLL